MTGSCASADAAPETDSPACGSLEVFAPPSGLPNILVRSPNVEFPYLKSLPRDRRSPCFGAPWSVRAVDAKLAARATARRSSLQAIKSRSRASREGLDRTRAPLTSLLGCCPEAARDLRRMRAPAKKPTEASTGPGIFQLESNRPSGLPSLPEQTSIERPLLVHSAYVWHE